MARSAISKYAYYVHYLASKFIKQQKLPQDLAFTNYAQTKVQNRAKRLQTNVSVEDKKHYATFLSALYGRNDSPDSSQSTAQYTSADLTNLYDAVTQWVTNSVDPKYNLIFDRYSGQVFNDTTMGSPMQVLTTAGDIPTHRYLTLNQLKELQSYLNRIETELKKIISTGAAVPIELINLETNIVNVLTKVATTLKGWASNPDLKTLKELAGTRKLFGKESSNEKRFDAQDWSLGKLNEQIKACKKIVTVNTIAQGKAGEGLAAVAGELACGLGLQQINSHIQAGLSKQVIGSQPTTIQYNVAGMPTSMQKYINVLAGDEVYSINKYIKAKKTGSQQKIDIIINLPDTNSVKGIKPVRGSVKSIDLRHNIGIVSGTNLWYLIQDENVKSYLRPVLNVMADHLDYLKHPNIARTVDGVQEAIAVSQVAALRQDAFNSFRIIAAYKALSGDTFGRSAAQLFIINDVHSAQIYVLEINDIIQAICNNLTENQTAINRYFYFAADIANLKNMILDNSWQKTIDQRMAGVINSAHQKKVTVSLKPNFLKALPIEQIITGRP